MQPPMRRAQLELERAMAQSQRSRSGWPSRDPGSSGDVRELAVGAGLVERKLIGPAGVPRGHGATSPAHTSLRSASRPVMIDAHSAFGAVGTGPKRQARSSAVQPRCHRGIERCYAVMGSAFTAFAILAIALMALAFNHPRAPRWVQRELTAQLSAVLVTIVLGVGLACLAMTVGHVLADGVALVELAALAGALALVVAGAARAQGRRPPAGLPGRPRRQPCRRAI